MSDGVASRLQARSRPREKIMSRIRCRRTLAIAAAMHGVGLATRGAQAVRSQAEAVGRGSGIDADPWQQGDDRVAAGAPKEDRSRRQPADRGALGTEVAASRGGTGVQGTGFDPQKGSQGHGFDTQKGSQGHGFDTQKGSFQTWITTLARNLLVDHFRRTRLDRASDSLDASIGTDPDGPTMADRLTDPRPSQEHHVAGLELKATIQDALKQLSPELREAVILRDLEDMDYKEIAQILHIPEGTVKSRISRGRGELARHLQRIERQIN